MNANTNRPVPIERASTASPDHIDEELRCYDEHLRDVRGLTSGTRRNYVRVAGRLLHRKFTDGTFDLSKLPTRPIWPRGFGVTSATEALAAIKLMH